MTDTSPEDSALRPAASDLHPADPTDDLTANTTAGDTSDLRGPDEPLAGDGSVAHVAHDRPDAMRTATYGRESAAARANLSDDRPAPTASSPD